MRKALNFDLDTKKYEEITGKPSPTAYVRIRNFLKKNDFEHRQGSGYVSKDSLNDGKTFAIIQNMSVELEWLRISNYELDYEKQIDLWNCTYFKLGMRDREKIRNEFFENKLKTKECDTFLNNKKDEFSEWLEEQKNKYTFETKEYKELQKKYNEISENYPNCIEVFEDLKPINLNIEEIKALIELRRIDIEMGNMEKDLCFKLGMKEIINF